MVVMVMKMMVMGIVHLSTSQAESKAIVVLFKLYTDHLIILVTILLTCRVWQDLKETMKTLHPPRLRMMMMIVDGDGHIQ